MRRFHALVLGSLISLSVGSVGGGVAPVYGQEIAGPLFAQGMRLYAARDFAGAVDYLGQVCDLVPNHQQARFYLIYSLVGIQKFDKALKHADQLMVLDPTNPQYKQLRNQIAAQMMAAPAAGATGSGTGSRPGVPPKEVMIGTEDPARSGREPMMSKDPPKPRPKPKVRTPLDDALDAIDMEDFASASSQLDTILKKDPKNAKALHFRGMIDAQQGRFAEAIPYFEKALAVQKDLFDTLFLLGDAQMKSGKVKEAEATFEKAVALKQDVFAIINLAEAKKKNGKAKDALELFRKALKIDGNSMEAKINLAEATADEGKPEEAMNLINDVLASDNTNAMAHFIKAKILFKSDLFDDAIAEQRLAMTASPNNEFFAYELAKTLMKTGKTGEALDLANNLMKNSPDAVEPRILIAEALIASGDIPNAEEHLTAIGDRKLPRVTLLKARIARKSGDKDKAVELYRAYLAEESTDGEVVFELASHFEENGDMDNAADFYTEVKKRFPGTPIAASAEEKLRALEAAKPAAQPAPGGGGAKPEPGKVKY